MTYLTKFLLGATLLASTLGVPCYGEASTHIKDYVKAIPGIGLISDSIEFEGIAISNFHFDTGHKYIFVLPESKFDAHMDYAIDSGALDTLHLHHFVIGLHGDGPQDCILHSLGMKDSSGQVTATLKAPKKPGVYQVRFCHAVGLTFTQAKEAWWRAEGASSDTIMGIVVVQ